MLFENREHAARLLAKRLSGYYKTRNRWFSGIPRGAVPIARSLPIRSAENWMSFCVRKLGHPSQPELAIGAIDESGNVFYRTMHLMWSLNTLKGKRRVSLKF